MPRKNTRRATAQVENDFFDARADLIERAYKRAIEYLLMTGEGEDDKRFYANVAFHVVTEVRRHRQLNFLLITNGAIQRYLSQRHSHFAAQ
jgi:hypothetical protein